MTNKPHHIDLWTIEHIIENLNRGENDAIPRALTWMQNKGSIVLLFWGEENHRWESSWTTGGKRYTGYDENMTAAIVACLLKVKHRNSMDGVSIEGRG